MQDLERALAEIGAIREQIAQGERFHGLGQTAFAATGVLALLAAAGQAYWLPNPAQHVSAFLLLWIAVAAVSAAVIGYEMHGRSRRLHSQLADEMIAVAVTQFLPAGAAGALLTIVLTWFAPQSLWMLPALWQIAFGLGVSASSRFLPKPMWIVGAWYLATALVCLALAQGAHAFSPWSMGIPYGVGQLMVTGVLRFAGQTDD